MSHLPMVWGSEVSWLSSTFSVVSFFSIPASEGNEYMQRCRKGIPTFMLSPSCIVQHSLQKYSDAAEIYYKFKLNVADILNYAAALRW